jgi:methyl-accepting chemotaxis protein/methyl-accepting chemotaxis protein-1 (serine sensor receptor)
LKPLLVTDEGKRIAEQFEEELAGWKATVSELIQAADKGDADGALKIANEKGLPIYAAVMRDTDRFEQIQNGLLSAQRMRGESVNASSRWIAALVLAFSVALGIVVLLVVRSVSRTLQRATEELSRHSEQVASAAGQVSSSSQALARGASDQAASIEETSASAEEISSTTQRNADESRQAAGLMNETSEVVEEANRTLEQMEASMRDINGSSERIGKIIKVIDEIAFQTNILALNAAVEAARAGEAGLGFAVVADEVRNLAQRCSQAAKDTASMIEESIAKSGEGRLKLEQVARAIGGITERASKVKALVDGVSSGIGEQRRGVEEIARAMTQVEQVTQTSAASSQEVASAGEELNSQAASLREIVNRLESLVGSNSTGGTGKPGAVESARVRALARH